MKKHCYADDIRRSIRALAAQIAASGHQFDAMLTMGGGGFIPARMLRTHLRIPVYTVTLAYCLNELQQADFTRLGVALHHKQKAKQARLPENLPYFSGMVVADDGIKYPWDADDIGAHNRQAAALTEKNAS